MDDAILAHSSIDVSRWRKVDEVPFDFERRRISVLVDDGESRLLVVKGAPEDILTLSTECEDLEAGRSAALDDSARERLRQRVAALGDQGFRVLGVAIKRVPREHPHAVVDDETGLNFCGLAAFLDPPKASTRAALGALAADGVTVKIVTGDNEHVTRHVCGMVGLEVTGVLNGADIALLDDAGLGAAVESANLFCRVNPQQKNRIVLALKARGHVVGYLGDGVNDAPPLHSADVGLSVDTAVDVARSAADMILLAQDLGVVHGGVLEGRRTVANVMKYIMMGTSSNFGNMFSMALASVFLPFLPMAPTQILLNNLLYDISELPIPMDRVDPGDLVHPRTWNMAFVRDFMWVLGPVSSLFDFLTFVVLLKVFDAGERLFQTGWFIESLATQVLVIFVIRTRGSPFASRPRLALVVASVAVVAAAALLPLTPLGSYIGFVAPPPSFYALTAGLVAVYLVLVECVKRLFYRHHAVA
jgi:Mg2+-importing ATPase